MDKNEELKKITEKGKGTFEEFKAFIARGNIIDMAVGVIVGSAFSAIVTSLVNNIITPLIGLLIGGLNFEGLSIGIGDAQIQYGLFIQSIIDFLIVAACIFSALKVLQAFKKKEEEKPAEPAAPDPQIVLLEEIRDLLKEQKK